jgi:hypothetical protein
MNVVQLGDLVVQERGILKWSLNKENVDWIHLAQDDNQ